MIILGHGIDLVEVERIKSFVVKNDDFVSGWFSAREIAALGNRAADSSTIAGRVAAKEAVVKALGCGFNDDVAWQDVEILTTESGAPTVHLSGGALVVANTLGVSGVLVSISNTPTSAIASAIAIGN